MATASATATKSTDSAGRRPREPVPRVTAAATDRPPPLVQP
jgi:hypothetical protein